MLTELYIRNYALIEELTLGFDGGLSVITGETGTGKSILLGALALILGKRAETDVLKNPAERCIVEGHFDIRDYGLEPYFLSEDIEYADLSIFRREIHPNGKSRAFINDSPVSLTVMKTLGDQLVDIHSQHKTLAINQSDVQLALLDEFAGLKDHVAEVQQYYQQWYILNNRLIELELREKTVQRDLDYKSYLYHELDTARLRVGETANLEEEIGLLRNQEEIKANLWRSINLLEDGDSNVKGMLSHIAQGLSQCARYLQEARFLSDRLEIVRIELDDLARDIQGLLDKIEEDPQRLEQLEERLSLVYDLLRKHDARDEDHLLIIQSRLQQELQEYDSNELLIKQLREDTIAARALFHRSATALGEARKAASPAFESNLLALLSELGMPDAEIAIRLINREKPSIQGYENIQILFNANKGGNLNELAKVASGGERSRLMLAMKSCITSRNLLPTIIFDEIDTGVSGTTANKVAEMLESMGQRMQVIVITHLPQIASRGKIHFIVRKESHQGKTNTTVSLASEQERVEEISKMISGPLVGDISKEAARQLLQFSSKS